VPGEAFALFVAAALASALLTGAWIVIARRRALHDLPGRRRLHDTATPRGGGIGIALAMLGALAWLAASPGHEAAWASGFAAGIAAFAAVGLLDDLRTLPAAAKLALQLAASGVLLACAAGYLPSDWLAGIALLFTCAYFVNIWNFMDGSNGLVDIQALLLSLALAAWPGQEPALRLAALALAGACLGFLPFNFPRARVFLGDVGSHAMGAAVFGLLWLSWREGVISAAQALLMLTVVVLDSGLTLARRLLAGRVIWHAHREHLYQYAVRRGNSHARVAIAYGAATVLAIALAWLGGRSRSDFVLPGLLMLTFGLGALLYWSLRRRWLELHSKRDLKNE
jgi:UDP-N-acetylmuramyl pentapeptide phosphotransferase/UDP-N-acetylglucosamine-1-phosphate transferase